MRPAVLPRALLALAVLGAAAAQPTPSPASEEASSTFLTGPSDSSAPINGKEPWPLAPLPPAARARMHRLAGPPPAPAPRLPAAGWASLATVSPGSTNPCGIYALDGNRAYCWGRNLSPSGQLANYSQPTAVPSQASWTQLTSGHFVNSTTGWRDAYTCGEVAGVCALSSSEARACMNNTQPLQADPMPRPLPSTRHPSRRQCLVLGLRLLRPRLAGRRRARPRRRPGHARHLSVQRGTAAGGRGRLLGRALLRRRLLLRDQVDGPWSVVLVRGQGRGHAAGTRAWACCHDQQCTCSCRTAPQPGCLDCPCAGGPTRRPSWGAA